MCICIKCSCRFCFVCLFYQGSFVFFFNTIKSLISGVCLRTSNHFIDVFSPCGRKNDSQNPLTKQLPFLTVVLPPHNPSPWKREYFPTDVHGSDFGLSFLFSTNGVERHMLYWVGPCHAPLPPRASRHFGLISCQRSEARAIDKISP